MSGPSGAIAALWHADAKLRHMREAQRLRAMAAAFPVLDTAGNRELAEMHDRAAELLTTHDESARQRA
jgi:hypothetical protein